MDTGKEQVARKVFIDCPVCCSGSRFQLEDTGEELVCDDCGFVLAEAPELKAADSERCVFCGGEYFYFESPLPLLGKDSVCYVCEAKYKGVRMHKPEQKFSPETQAGAQDSDASKRWRQRVELYNQRTG
jgi:transcription initiation factor TFIIIB Brf1 subunit/transcription initiation factor TFIIB